MSQSRGFVVAAFFAFLVGWSSSAQSQRQSMSDVAGERGPFKPTWTELSMLPSYCRARVVTHLPEAKRWAVAFGPTWEHIHHYCEALRLINEIRFSGMLMQDNERIHKWGRVIGEIDYVRVRADRRFPLMSEMIANRQMAEGELMILGLMK